MKSKKKKINSAVIGLGVGEFHAKNIYKNNSSRLMIVSDYNPKKNILIKNNYKNCIFTSNSNEIFKNPMIDLVCISSYDNYHFKNIFKCIKTKKHFFVEKPFCLNIKELKKIFLAMKRNKEIKFSSNLVLRNSPQFVELKKNIEKKKMGMIYHVEGSYNYGRILKITKGWRGKIPFYSVTLGGGLHIIDLILWLTNQKVEKVISIGNNISTKGTNFRFNDNVVALLKFSNGMTAKINSNFSSVTPHHHSLEMFGTKKSFFQKYKSYFYFRNRGDKKPKEKSINFTNKMKSKVLSSFINSLHNPKIKPLVKKQEIFDAMSVSLAIEKSMSSKKWEKVKYFKI